MISLNFERNSELFYVPYLPPSVFPEENPSDQKAEGEEEAVKNKTDPSQARKEERL